MLRKISAVQFDQGRMLVKAAVAHPELCTATGTQTRFFPKNWTPRKYYLENQDQVKDIVSLNVTCLYNWGKTRHGWRRWLEDLFLEDMAPHHLDYMRYLTGMDVVQVQGVNFRPIYSNFRGSSTTYAIMALATPENYHNKDNWIYATYRGDWVKKGEIFEKFELNCTGADITLLNKETTVTVFEDEEGFKFHKEILPIAEDVEYNENNYPDQVYILDQFSKGIDSHGEIQPSTNFRDAYKSFCIGQGIKESFRTGQAVFIPKYFENLPL